MIVIKMECGGVKHTPKSPLSFAMAFAQRGL
jgi:hypothetical protein